MLGNYLQQTTSADDIFRCIFPGALRVNCSFALLQLLDLFLNEDWSVYLADYGNPKAKYLRVQPQVAISILEK